MAKEASPALVRTKKTLKDRQAEIIVREHCKKYNLEIPTESVEREGENRICYMEAPSKPEERRYIIQHYKGLGYTDFTDVPVEGQIRMKITQSRYDKNNADVIARHKAAMKVRVSDKDGPITSQSEAVQEGLLDDLMGALSDE